MRIRIGHLSTFYHTSTILMARGTIDRDLGCEIEWKIFGTGPAIVNAFEKGELDLAYIGLPPAIIGIDKGVDIVCVAGGHIEGTVISGRKELAGFPEKGNLRDILNQLRGGKFGVPGKGSIHDVIITECLEKFNLRGKIEIVHFPWADRVTEAMVKGEVSAAAGTPALAVAIKSYAGGRILYPPSKLWPDNPSYGILVAKGFLRKERKLVERFLVLHEEATSLIRRNPRGVSRMISDYVGFIDEEFVLETLMISPKYCAQLTDGYIASTMEFVRAMKKLGYINRMIAPDKIFDISLIRKIHPLKDHYSERLSNDGA